MKIKQILLGVLALGCACAFGENTTGGESLGVAVQKLQTCDFLLNKDFKKNAKYYLCLFSASWCGPCRAEMPRIAKTYAESLKDDPNIELIHFSRDSDEGKALAWAKEHDVKFPVVKPNGGNPLDLHSRGIPHLFIVDADGKLLEEGHPAKLFTNEKLNALKTGTFTAPETATEKTRKAIAKLFPGWSLDTEVCDHDWAGIQPFHRGKRNVTFVHPKNRETPSVISRTVKLSGNNPCLSLCVASWNDDADFMLSVRVNGKDALTNRLVCTPDAVPWEDIVVPLSPWRGSTAKIEVVFACNGWACEFPYLARVDIIEADGDMSINEGKWEADGYTWSYRAQNGEATIVAENDGRFSAVSPCPVGSIAIPATIAGAKVKHIGRGAFRDCSTMTSVIIPEGVSRIGREAFRDCTGLKSIKIPSSVQIIERDAFAGCNGLASVSIPEGVTSIDRGAFYWCCGLGSIEIPSSVTHIGKDAFHFCLGLSSITIPENVTDIGPGAFHGCNALASLTIPASVTNIDSTAFRNTGALTSIHVAPGNRFYKSENGLLLTKDGTTLVRGVNGDATIPPSVTAIGNCAFEGCVALWSVEIPSGVKSIGSFAFKQCRGMKSVTIPPSVTDIGQQAFFGCDALTSVTMCGERPNASNNIFERCGNLKSIHVPANAKSWAGMEDDWQGIPLVFDGAAEQQMATVDGYTWSYRVENGKATIVAEKDGKYSCAVSPAPTGDLKIPATLGGVKVTRLGSWAFSGCSGLKGVTIPGNVTSIGRRAFCGCSSLSCVTIPDGVTSIGSLAFFDCSGLKSVTIPNSVTNIDENAFGGRRSRPMLMPRRGLLGGQRPLNARGNESGEFNGLESFSVDPDNPSYSSRNGMLCTKDGSIIIVGVNGDIVIPECVTSIGNGAFAGCTNLTGVTIPNSVTSIREHAFSDCKGLMSVSIPKGVTNVGDFAFEGCSGLVNVTIGDGVTSIGSSAFCNCTNLMGVTIPDSVTNIDSRAFYGCKNIASVDVVKEGKVEKVSFQDFCKQWKLLVDVGIARPRSLQPLRLGPSLRERRAALREQERAAEVAAAEAAKERAQREAAKERAQREAAEREEAARREAEERAQREAEAARRNAEREEQRKELQRLKDELEAMKKARKDREAAELKAREAEPK